MLSGLKDTDREILKWANDEDLLRICSVDRKTWNEVCDDAFLRRRLIAKYPGIEKYKKENESWKHFFLDSIRSIALMKEKFEYDYSGGDFRQQYSLLRKYKDNMTDLLLQSAGAGIFPLVVYAVNRGGDIHAGGEAFLSITIDRGYLDLVKYAVEKGLDIHRYDDFALFLASKRGHLDIVKYLVEKGANIHAGNDAALNIARKNGHEDVVRYLESL